MRHDFTPSRSNPALCHECRFPRDHWMAQHWNMRADPDQQQVIPGAEAVREVEHATPEFDLPFALTAEAVRDDGARARGLFDAIPSYSRCDNCGTVWRDWELEPARDLAERVDEGNDIDEINGECPSCGALCYSWSYDPQADDAREARRLMGCE